MSTLELQAACADLRVAVRDTSNEDDIERLLQLVYIALGYLNVGQDILGKRKGKSGIPDVRLANRASGVYSILPTVTETSEIRPGRKSLANLKRLRDSRPN